jgi:hypothetical protein
VYFVTRKLSVSLCVFVRRFTRELILRDGRNQQPNGL